MRELLSELAERRDAVEQINANILLDKALNGYVQQLLIQQLLGEGRNLAAAGCTVFGVGVSFQIYGLFTWSGSLGVPTVRVPSRVKFAKAGR